MKYLKPRGGWFHFERVVPKDVQHILGKKPWREALETDSRVEAEIRCRRRTVETEEVIRQARDGTLRDFSDDEVSMIAVQWSIDFQQINRENIARDAFSDVWENQERLGDEAPTPIFQNKADLEKSVGGWLARLQTFDVRSGSPDWDALVDACLDEYLVSNPEISNAWVQIHKELGIEPKPNKHNVFGTLGRAKKANPEHALSSVFRRYLKINKKIGESARSDFGTSVRRFIEFHGDMDVSEITRVHIEQFRDGVILLPVRPPHKIRSQPMKKQIVWAEEHDAKRFEQGTVNKNLMGVKRTLDFAFEETSIIEDRNWRNPCDGFSKSVGQSKNPIKAFTPDQIGLVFSSTIYTTKTAERFWIPLILFFTGARLDEICQLHVTDIVLEPVPHILTENLEDEDPALAKRLKTLSSHRTIPLHAGLISLGFLQYVEAIRRQGHIHLFPDLPHENGKAANQKSGLDTLSLRTHSLRHSYRLAGYEVPDQEFVKIVMGHYVSGDSVQTYGPEIYRMPKILSQRVTELINLPAVDVNFLKSEAKRHLKALE